MNIFWISFSYNGRNNGVCLIMADCENSALDKMDNLGIKPKYDDVLVIALEELGPKDSQMKFNRLYSRDDMMRLGYNSVNTVKYNE